MREPGLPVYLRAPNRALVTVAFLAFGCAMAYLGARESWVLVAVVCFGAAVALVAFARMEWAVLGLVVMANLDGFLKPLFSDRFSLFLKDYFILLGLLRWLWGLLLEEERPSVRALVAIPMTLFAGYIAAQLANPNAPSLLASLAGIRAWLLWLPVFFVAYDSLRSRMDVERLWMLATAVSGLVAVYGIVQYFIGFEHLFRLADGFRYYAKMGYVVSEGRVLRVFSTMVYPGAFGTAMGFMVFGASGMAFAARRPAARLLALACVPVIVVGLFLSGARTAIVAGAVGAAVFALLARRPALLAVGAVLVLVGFWQTTRLTGGGIEERLATVTWERASERASGPFLRGLEIAWHHPLGLGVASGTGVGRFGLGERATQEVFLENDIGRAFAELGIGAVLYLALLITALATAMRAYLRLPNSPPAVLASALLGGMVVLLVSLSTGAALYGAPGGAYFWLALASVLRLPDLPDEPPADGERSRPP